MLKPIKQIGNYILKQQIGAGQFGTVFMAQRKGQESQVEVAIKQIEKIKSKQNQSLIAKNEFENLINICAHPNIVQIFEVIGTANNMYIVMEFCNGGTLASYFKRNKLSLEENIVQCIAAQLINALKHLRDSSILHRDIKPENILIDQQVNSKIFKITDFGLSKNLNPGEMAHSQCGTPLYSAPEVLTLSQYEFRADL